MLPHNSSGIVLHENRFSIRYGDKARDCLCRVTFDLTRKRPYLIDCLESLHEIVSLASYSKHENSFEVLLPGCENAGHGNRGSGSPNKV